MSAARLAAARAASSIVTSGCSSNKRRSQRAARKLGLWGACPRTPYDPYKGIETRRYDERPSNSPRGNSRVAGNALRVDSHGSPQLDSRLLADAALALTLLVLSVTKAPITDAVKAAARVNRDQGGGK